MVQTVNIVATLSDKKIKRRKLAFRWRPRRLFRCLCDDIEETISGGSFLRMKMTGNIWGGFTEYLI